jgi:N-methylhydantoinase A
MPAAAAHAPYDERPVYLPQRGFAPTPIYRRDQLAAGTRLSGPAVVEAVDSTILVHPGQELSVDETGLVRIHVPR